MLLTLILVTPSATAGLVPGESAGSDTAAGAVTSIPFLNLSIALANRLQASLLDLGSRVYYNSVSSDWTTLASTQYSTLGNAFIVAGLLQLYQATENQTYLLWASTTSNQFWNHAWAPETGGFYDMYYPDWAGSTCDQIAQDNAMFEIDFLSLYHLNGSSQWLQRAGAVEQLLNNRFWNATDNIIEIGYDPCTGTQSGDVSIESSIGSYLWATGEWSQVSGNASYMTRMNAAASFAHRYLWDGASNSLQAGPGSTDCGGTGGSLGFMRTVYANLTGLEDCRKGANEGAWGAIGLAELYSLTGNSTLLSWTDQDLSWINSTLWDPALGGYHNDTFRDDALRSSCSSTNDPDDYPGWTQGEQPMLWWKIGELTGNATQTRWSLVSEEWTAEHQWNYTNGNGGDMTCLNGNGLPDTGSPELYDWIQGSALYSFSTMTSAQASTNPTFSDVSVTGAMKAGTPVTFNTKWTDATGLSSYIPSYDPGSGVLVNGSSVGFSGTTSWSNFTETLPGTIGTRIQWQVYASDTSSLSNKTDTACAVTGFKGNVAASSYATIVDDCYDLLVYDGTNLYNLGALPQLVHTTSTSTGYHVIAWNPAFTSALLVGYGDALVRYASGMFTILDTGLTPSIGLNGVAWRPNNNTFALIAGDDGKLLSYSNGAVTLLASSTTQMLQKVAWSPDGKYALIVGSAGTILKYTADTGAITSIPSGIPGNNLQGVAFAPDGAAALMAGSAGRVLEYASASGTVSSPLAGVGSSYQFQDVEFSLDGTYALLTSQNNVRGDLVRWTASSGTFDNITSGVSSTANQIAFAPNDSYAYVTTTAGIILRESYNSNVATQIPLTDNRLRGIAFYAPGSPLSLDGRISGGVSLGTALSVSLTTSCSPDVIVALIGENTARATAKAGTPTSPGMVFTLRASLQSGIMRTWEYYSIATGPLTSQAITEAMSQQTAYTVTAFGVCGANTAAPFDTGAGLPKTTGGLSGTTHSNTVSTSSANDLIFDLDASQGNPSYVSLNGYASVLTQQVSSWMASSTEYKVVSSVQTGSSLGFSLSIGESGSQIVDAIMGGSRATTVTQPITLSIDEAGGSTVAFAVSGCGASPTTIQGDGASHPVVMQASCSFTLSYTSSGTTRYGFIAAGAFSGTSPSQTSCSIGTCTGVSVGYDLQEKLMVVGGYGLSYSAPSETNDGWYKYGDSLTVSSNGVSMRTNGSGQRVASWQLDAGPITSIATLGQVTTSTIAMKAAHMVTFASVGQFQLTFSASGAGTASATTSPSIAGDAGWYDAGTGVGISAAPSSGGIFVSWSGSGSGSYTGANDPASVVMNAPVAETATFQPMRQGSLSLDGSASAGTNFGTTVSVSLTTSCSPDVVVVLVGEDTGRATATAAAPTAQGLTFASRASLQSGVMRLWEFYAMASSPLASREINEVMSQQTAYTVTAFGVCGANTATPFDTGAGLPKTTGGLSGTSHPNKVTTSGSNDFTFDFDASQGNLTYTTLNGYTSVLSLQVPSWMASSAEYKVVSSTQSGTLLGFTLGIGESGSQIVDAIVAASAPALVPVSTILVSSSATPLSRNLPRSL